jgi:hypothetical protein
MASVSLKSGTTVGDRYRVERLLGREAWASSRKNRGQRRIEELLGSLTAGDRLLVSGLSRLG